jgi:hypothetical protein
MNKSCIPLILLLIGFAQAQTRGAESGIWVVYGGKDQFRLEEARRIPAGEMVSIRGYPLPKMLPQVWLRQPDSDKREALEVTAEPANDSWIADVPTLKPNSRTDIIIRQFRLLIPAETEAVKRTLEKMLLSLSAGVHTGSIPADADAIEMGRAIERYLMEQFPPDKTLAEYIRIENGEPVPGTLGEALIRLIGTQGVADLTLRNLVPSYHSALRHLNDVVRGQLSSVSLPPQTQEIIADFWKRLPEGLFAPKAEVAAIWMKDVLNQEPPLLPIPSAVSAALGELITVANQGSLRENIKTLDTPLEEKFPNLFSSVRRIESVTYSAQTTSFPFLSADVLRYGTVDFVQGYVTGIKEPRGFLILSFFPTGPQERTPNGVLGGRVAIALGHSVTGGGEKADDFFLVGLSLRNNRYISMTAGGVTSTQGSKPWYGFIGIAGDLTAVPFLNNLFTTQP